MVYAQTTAGRNEAVRQRRRKLDIIPWHGSDTVLLLQLTQTPDPANQRRKLWFFRVHRYKIRPFGESEWVVDEHAFPVPREWFKAYKNKDK